VDFDFQCLLCGAQFDGVLHVKPERCPECQAPERYIESAKVWDRIEAENRAINKRDEFKEEELRNGC